MSTQSKRQSPHKRLFLTGYRGTGKSTVANSLAGKLGWESIDTDDLIESEAGQSIADIFAEEGEAGFRDREMILIRQVADRDRAVIALGGGAILREETRLLLARSGPVVWLTASAEVLAERLAADLTTDTRRPDLTGRGVLEEIGLVLAERTPIYRAAADLEVSTETLSPQQVAEQISAWIGAT